MAFVAVAETAPSIAIAPAPYPVPVIVTYVESPAAVSSKTMPFASVIATLVIVTGFGGAVPAGPVAPAGP